MTTSFSRLPLVWAGGILMLVASAGVLALVQPRLPDPGRIEGDPVRTLLPPDAIPSIDKPEFVPAKDAGFMRDEEPVVALTHQGIAKAYSTWHLDRHEIVNDSFGPDPLAVTW